MARKGPSHHALSARLMPSVSASTSGSAQTSFDVGSITLTSETNVDVPTVAQIFTANTMTVYGGIPHAHLTITPTTGVNVGTPIVFVGLGQLHASNSATWDFVDNQVLPIRGIGTFDLDLIGGGTRLQPDDKLALRDFSRALREPDSAVLRYQAIKPAFLQESTMLKILAFGAVLGASFAAPALALNPQPLPPLEARGALVTGEHYEIIQSHLILGSGPFRHRAKAGLYKLPSGQTLQVDATGKLTSETLNKFPSLGRAELNPQPLPP